MGKTLCPKCAYFQEVVTAAGWRFGHPYDYRYYKVERGYLCKIRLSTIRKLRTECPKYLNKGQLNLGGRKIKVSIFDEIEGIGEQLLSSDLPDEIVAKVTKIEKTVKTGQFAGAPQLKVHLELDDGRKTSTVYRIPKAWTGKGQLDKLKAHLADLSLTLKQMQGKTFHWKREKLGGSVQGNPRHYPIRRLEETRA